LFGRTQQQQQQQQQQLLYKAGNDVHDEKKYNNKNQIQVNFKQITTSNNKLIDYEDYESCE